MTSYESSSMTNYFTNLVDTALMAPSSFDSFVKSSDLTMMTSVVSAQKPGNLYDAILLGITEFYLLLETLKLVSIRFKKYKNFSSKFKISFPFLNNSFRLSFMYTVTLVTPERNVVFIIRYSMLCLQAP